MLNRYYLGQIDDTLAQVAFAKHGGVHIRSILDPVMVTEALAALREAFSSTELLEAISYDSDKRLGYLPLGSERLQRRGGPNYHRHTIDYRPDSFFRDANLVKALTPLYHDAVHIGLTILSHLGTASGPDLYAGASRGKHCLKIAHYLLPGTGPDRVLFDEHVDFGFLTVFIGSGVGGLQVRVDGSLVDAELDVGDVLVGAGTPLAKFLPAVSALRHRVVERESDRLSPFLLLDPNEDLVLPGRGKETFARFRSRILDDILSL